MLGYPGISLDVGITRRRDIRAQLSMLKKIGICLSVTVILWIFLIKKTMFWDMFSTLRGVIAELAKDIAWGAVGDQIEPYLRQHAMAAPLWCGLGMPFPKQQWY